MYVGIRLVAGKGCGQGLEQVGGRCLKAMTLAWRTIAAPGADVCGPSELEL